MNDIEEPKGILPITPENYPERIPDFKTEEEARDFWDTHDSTPYEDQFELVFDSRDDPLPLPKRNHSPARTRRPGESMQLLSVRFPASMIEAIKDVAVRRHLPYQTLLRSWVGERLAQEIAAGEHTTEKKAS
jgi:hypothetical protein